MRCLRLGIQRRTKSTWRQSTPPHHPHPVSETGSRKTGATSGTGVVTRIDVEGVTMTAATEKVMIIETITEDTGMVTVVTEMISVVTEMTIGVIEVVTGIVRIMEDITETITVTTAIQEDIGTGTRDDQLFGINKFKSLSLVEAVD